AAGVRRDPQARTWHAALRKRADGLLDDPPSRYELPDGKRLLSVCRRVVERVYTLATVYRLDKRPEHLERVWAELEAAAAFRDWNPSHFLDTAEMTHAFAIAYDWLYHDWTDDQRRRIREAIVNKGLTPGRQCYRGKERFGWWVKSVHNWNQVCNGGMVMGALAVAERDGSPIAREVLSSALGSIRLAMAEYAPDGGYREGAAYWSYGTGYNVLMIAALESALGRDFGLSRFPGFAQTGFFPVYMTGPSGHVFNFADARDRPPGGLWSLHWLGRRFQQPAFSRFAAEHAGPVGLDLLWHLPRPLTKRLAPLPRIRVWKQVAAGSIRSSWTDPLATYVAFKGGSPRFNHAQADLGSFVLDALGQRWIADLGPDDYNLPGYFDRQKSRWNYYRNRAEGHNTLVLNPGKGPDQHISAQAPIARLGSGDERPFGIVDLSSAYPGQARSVRRGFTLLEGRDVLVQDEIDAEAPVSSWWFVHTAASIRLADDGRGAMLSRGGRQLGVTLLSPARARFALREAAPFEDSPRPEKQAANNHVRKLAIHLTDVKQETIAVVFRPVREGAELPAERIKPLDRW
ncbi:MAG: heparinase II/III-family protein, partial [Phycisphaerae bacterium]|nr:heparinase II/III-family protein [Phycisphaerae bacterium]